MADIFPLNPLNDLKVTNVLFGIENNQIKINIKFDNNTNKLMYMNLENHFEISYDKNIIAEYDYEKIIIDLNERSKTMFMIYEKKNRLLFPEVFNELLNTYLKTEYNSAIVIMFTGKEHANTFIYTIKTNRIRNNIKKTFYNYIEEKLKDIIIEIN